MTPRTAVSSRKQRELARRTHCGSPRCLEPNVPGHRFCATHTAELAAIKADMDQRAAAKGRSAVLQRETVRPRRPSTPTCCSIGCFEPRIPPAAFCDSCREAGATEEDAE